MPSNAWTASTGDWKAKERVKANMTGKNSMKVVLMVFSFTNRSVPFHYHQRGFLLQQMVENAGTLSQTLYRETLKWRSPSGPSTWSSWKHMEERAQRFKESE